MEKEEFKLGELKFIEFLPKGNNGNALYECFCGKKFITHPYYIKIKRTSSCGCYKKSDNRYIDGRTKTRLLKIYNGILQRTTNPKNPDYYKYGGRGIIMCNEWKNDFTIFKKWAEENGYENGLTIDRIKNNKGYYPENCRWASLKEQFRNKNKISKNCSSKYKGVQYDHSDKCKNKYRARICVNYKRIHLGRFATETEAAQAYNEAAIKHFGEFAVLNKINDFG